MELLLISKNKIRISLTKEDLDGYMITCDRIDYDNTETRRVFWCIFDEVKQKTGFDAAERRIFIQIYPDKSGGCEIYVSKINAPQNAETDRDNSYVSFGTRDPAPSAVKNVYSFDETKDLISACRQLLALKYGGHSDAYTDSSGKFYLAIEPETQKTDVLTEYGSRHTSQTILSYIGEHCESICKDRAVQTLGDL